MTPDVADKKAKLEAILGRLQSNRERLGRIAGHPLAHGEEEAVTVPLYQTGAPAAAAPSATPVAAVRAPAAPVAAVAASGTPAAAPAPPAPAPRLKPLPPRPGAHPVAPPPGGLASSLSRPAPAPTPEAKDDVTWEGADEEEMEISEVRDVDAPPEPAEEGPLGATVPHSQAVEPPPPPPLPSTTVSPSAAAVPAGMPARPARVAVAPVAAVRGEETSPRAMRVEAPSPVEAPVIRTVGGVEAERARSIGDLLRNALRMFESG